MNIREIIDWANNTVAAKGAKFTPLSKEAQYEIAKLILKLNEETEKKEPYVEPSTNLDEGGVCEPQQKPIDDLEGVSVGIGLPVPSEVQKATKIRRGEYYRTRGFDSQAVYDEYLAWASKNPRDSVVMDFSNGQKNDGASFAYWLEELIEVLV